MVALEKMSLENSLDFELASIAQNIFFRQRNFGKYPKIKVGEFILLIGDIGRVPLREF